MLKLPLINRHAALALRLQDRRRARRAPVLLPLYPGMLAWEWPYPDPYQWQVWMSGDGGATWSLVNDYWAWGDARQFSPDGSWQRYYIVGVNAAGVAVTGRSNEVRPDEATPLAPVALLTGLGSYWKLDESDGWVRSDSMGGRSLFEFDVDNINNYVGSDMGVLGSAAVFTTWEGARRGLMCSAAFGWDNAGDFSIAGWMRYVGNGAGLQTLFLLGSTVEVLVDSFSQALLFRLLTVNQAEESSWEMVGSPNEALPENTWIHVAAVKESGVLKVYLNGACVGTQVLANTPVAEGTFDLFLGCGPAGMGLEGLMDEWGVWSRALSAAEIGTLYSGGTGFAFENF